MDCPHCGAELPNKPKKEWKYIIYQVKMFACQKCNKSTKAYYKDRTLSHTIPKGKR